MPLGSLYTWITGANAGATTSKVPTWVVSNSTAGNNANPYAMAFTWTGDRWQYGQAQALDVLNRAEEERHRYEEQCRYEERARQRLQALQAAAVKARALLETLLDDKQKRELKRSGTITVTGGQTGRRYRIGALSYVGNILQLDRRGRTERGWCCHLADPDMPVADHVIAQMLTIQHNEAHFLATAH